jgi:molecular chaperone GrpE
VNFENNDTKTEDLQAEKSAAADQVDQLRTERDGAKAERDGARAERDEIRDLLLRRQAEFENFRKRTEKERSDYLQYAAMDMVRDLLPILDDFERALKIEGAAPEYARGIEMIYNRMYETLKKMGLEPIASDGKTFDPNLHQAVERVETKDSPDGTILSEFQRGYLFKGKLLRPTMVKVAVRA